MVIPDVVSFAIGLFTSTASFSSFRPSPTADLHWRRHNPYVYAQVSVVSCRPSATRHLQPLYQSV